MYYILFVLVNLIIENLLYNKKIGFLTMSKSYTLWLNIQSKIIGISASATPSTPSETPRASGKVLSKAELLEKLVGPVTHHNPIHVMHERRMFFERLIDFCERNGGEPITMVTE